MEREMNAMGKMVTHEESLTESVSEIAQKQPQKSNRVRPDMLIEEDFKLFKKECLNLQKEWGLNGWEIYFEISESKKEYATIRTDYQNHKAKIFYGGVIDEWFDAKKTAKHEMLHLLLGRLSGLAEDRYVTEDSIIEAEEEVVQMLLKLIYEYPYQT